MSGYHNQEMLLGDVTVPQRTVIRACKNQNIIEDGIEFEHITRNKLYQIKGNYL